MQAQPPFAGLPPVDHLVYAAPDLDQGIDSLERLLGVRATPGGRHQGEGTWNALIPIGPARYLEIIAPDPGQPTPVGPRWFGLDTLTAPRLVSWAAKGTRLEERARIAGGTGIPLGRVRAGSRQQPDGQVVSWIFTDPHALLEDGLIPFLIDWGASPHPAEGGAPGITLVSLRAEHPAPDRIRAMLATLGIRLEVKAGERPALVASLRTPHAVVELR